MSFNDFFTLAKQAALEWSEDRVSRLAAALAYYTVFSIPAILLIVLAILGNVVDMSQAELQQQITTVLPSSAAETVASMVESAGRPGSGGIIATIVGIATLIFAATGVFAQLQDAMNTVWEVAPDPQKSGIMAFITDRAMAFLMVIGIGALFLLSAILTTAIAGVDPLVQALPGSEWVQQIINFLVSWAIVSLLFAVLFKVVPDVSINWSGVWIGAIATGFLFMLGQIAMAYYLGSGARASSYGAAGGLVVLLLWVYYSTNIMFLGAEFTQVYVNQYGSDIRLEEGAIPLREAVARKQGLPSTEPEQPGDRVLRPGRERARQARQSQPTQQAEQREPAPSPYSAAARSTATPPPERTYVRRETRAEREEKKWSPRDYAVGALALVIGLVERSRRRDGD